MRVLASEHGPLVQLAETYDLSSSKCRFESDGGYQTLCPIIGHRTVTDGRRNSIEATNIEPSRLAPTLRARELLIQPAVRRLKAVTARTQDS